ncbi:MAG: SDR family NAD(P)-dependent oxidoreductase, partial [Rhizobiaceae bacterium]
MKLTQNTILITGGSSGIGQALAIALHKAGNQVIISGRNEKALAETAAAHPGMAFEVADMQDAASIQSLATSVVAKFPKLNVVISNAGIMTVEDATTDQFDVAK